MTTGKSKQPNNRLGRGMKPRGEQPAAQAEGNIPMAESTEQAETVSTDQVQAEGTKPAPEGVANEVQTPPNQEPEMPDLAKMLLASAEHGKARDAERVANDISHHGKAETVSGVQPSEEPKTVIAAIRGPAPSEELAKVLGAHGVQFVGEEEKPVPAVQVFDMRRAANPGVAQGFGLGPRPNGDMGVVITIPEYFVGSVKDFAEADGNKSVEQWCSEFFLMNLEAYCAPLKGR